MSNTILTPNIIANEALDVLRTNAVMANLVHRDYSSEFVAGVGDTITVRKPATFEAKEFTTEVEVQDATEGKVPVKMDKLLDVTFAVTSKELTMGIVDFSAQFLVPAMQAFADKIDGYLLALEKDVTNRVDHTKGAIAVADIIAARKFLVDAKAPSTERRFVYGSQAEADLLNTEAFTNASAVGDNGTALKEASLGRKYGLDFYCDQNVQKTTAETANYTPSIAFHKNAFALVTRQLEMPLGAPKAFSTSYDGFGLRVVQGYDQKTKTDTVSIDMLRGVKTLSPELAAVITDKRQAQRCSSRCFCRCATGSSPTSARGAFASRAVASCRPRPSASRRASTSASRARRSTTGCTRGPTTDSRTRSSSAPSGRSPSRGPWSTSLTRSRRGRPSTPRSWTARTHPRASAATATRASGATARPSRGDSSSRRVSTLGESCEPPVRAHGGGVREARRKDRA